jgi:hypothetical protein
MSANNANPGELISFLIIMFVTFIVFKVLFSGKSEKKPYIHVDYEPAGCYINSIEVDGVKYYPGDANYSEYLAVHRQQTGY